MLLDGDRHVAEHRGAAGSGDGEQVREMRCLQAEIGSRARRPGFLQLITLAALDVERQEGTGKRIETRREDNDVERIFLFSRLDSRFRDLDDRLGFEVDKK